MPRGVIRDVVTQRSSRGGADSPAHERRRTACRGGTVPPHSAPAPQRAPCGPFGAPVTPEDPPPPHVLAAAVLGYLACAALATVSLVATARLLWLWGSA